jgi:predicted permease
MFDTSQALPVLEAAVAVVNLLGVPAAIAVFALSKRRERIDRESGTYATLSQQYLDFLRLAFDNPDLPIYGRVELVRTLSAQEERKVECAFLIVISMIENAYLLYRQHSTSTRKKQWIGWRDYLLDYFQNPYFRSRWKELGWQFDTDFRTAVNELVAKKTFDGQPDPALR